MTKKIVIGVDGSAPSRAAIAWGLQRATAQGAPVQLVYISDVSPLSNEPAMLDEALSAAEKLVAEEKAYADSLGTGAEVTTLVRPGLPIRELEKLSREASLVVVGTHKGSRMQGVVLGTKGIKIAAVAHVPVAVIPTFSLEGRKGVVVGIDQEKSSEGAVDFAATEALSLGEPLTLVYAWSLPATPGLEYVWSDEIAQRLKEDAEGFLTAELDALAAAHPDLDVSGYAVQGAPVAALVERASNARLLVVGNRGRKGLSRLLLGSVSHGVLNNIPSPVIVVHTMPVPDSTTTIPVQEG